MAKRELLVKTLNSSFHREEDGGPGYWSLCRLAYSPTVGTRLQMIVMCNYGKANVCPYIDLPEFWLDVISEEL